MDKMRAENIGELQIWIDGKFELLNANQHTTQEEVRGLRTKVHDLSNEVAKLNAIDIEGKLKALENADQRHDLAIQNYDRQLAERRGAVAMLKIIYTTGGAAAGAGLTLLLSLAKAVH